MQKRHVSIKAKLIFHTLQIREHLHNCCDIVIFTEFKLSVVLKISVVNVAPCGQSLLCNYAFLCAIRRTRHVLA